MFDYRDRLQLQTAAVRRGNGFTTATIGLATNGITCHYGVHVTSSLKPHKR